MRLRLARELDVYAKVQAVNPHFYFPGAQSSPPEIDLTGLTEGAGGR